MEPGLVPAAALRSRMPQSPTVAGATGAATTVVAMTRPATPTASAG